MVLRRRKQVELAENMKNKTLGRSQEVVEFSSYFQKKNRNRQKSVQA